MAVDPMLKVTVIGHASVRRSAVRLLQDAGVLELITREAPVAELDALRPDPERLRELEEQIAEATFVRDLLGRYHTHSAPFSTFISEKVHLSKEDFDALEPDEDFRRLYGECQMIAEQLAAIERERTRLQALVHELAPWVGLRLQVAQWRGTEHVALFTGTVPELAAEPIRQMLRDAVDLVTVEEVGRAAGTEAWVVMAHHDATEDVRATLALTEFVPVSFPGIEDYPAEERARAIETLARLAAEEAELEAQALKLSGLHHSRSMAFVQSLLTRHDAETANECFLTSERTFIVTGWMPARNRDHIAASLAPLGGEIDLGFAEPAADEEVPVLLRNHMLVRPFEVLTDLYGRPRYWDLDPTPLLAGFFFIFFGMCVGDVGYGVLLIIAGLFIKHRLDVAPGVCKFMDLIMMGGLASILVGVATRSYFAIAPESLPPFLRYEPILDPLRDIMLVLMFSVALGVVHISLGVGVNAYRRIKAGDVAGAIFEDVTTLALFVVVGAVVAFPGTIGWLLPWSLVLAVVFKGRVIERIFIDRSIKGSLLGVGKGLGGLYGLVGYGSDFLSYTRLAALGLASLLVGDTMNRLAGLVSEVPYGIGILSAVLILVVGHAFNTVIALLGAFVHPTRLQFVEFFGKFYEGGGRPFAPLAQRTQSVVLHPGTGEPEGGVRK